jgi:hypothetical protein
LGSSLKGVFRNSLRFGSKATRRSFFQLNVPAPQSVRKLGGQMGIFSLVRFTLYTDGAGMMKGILRGDSPFRSHWPVDVVGWPSHFIPD